MLVLPMTILLFGFYFQQKKIHKEVKQLILSNISKEKLVHFTFSLIENEQLAWKDSKEFEYNHQLYDIVYQQVSENSVEYWCWKDDKETILYKTVTKLSAQFFAKDQTQEKNTKTILIYYQSLFYENIYSFFFKKINSILLIHQNYYFICIFSFFISVSFIPPEYI